MGESRLGFYQRTRSGDDCDDPYEYRLEDDGSFTIWSIGENLVDDGGTIPEKHAPWRGDDYVWNSRLITSDPAD